MRWIFWIQSYLSLVQREIFVICIWWIIVNFWKANSSVQQNRLSSLLHEYMFISSYDLPHENVITCADKCFSAQCRDNWKEHGFDQNAPFAVRIFKCSAQAEKKPLSGLIESFLAFEKSETAHRSQTWLPRSTQFAINWREDRVNHKTLSASSCLLVSPWSLVSSHCTTLVAKIDCRCRLYKKSSYSRMECPRLVAPLPAVKHLDLMFQIWLVRSFRSDWPIGPHFLFNGLSSSCHHAFCPLFVLRPHSLSLHHGNVNPELASMLSVLK